MIAETGRYALILALIVAAVQGCAPLLQVRLAARASNLAFALTALAFACLVWLFASSDFSVATVAANSHSAKPMLFRIAATWGNHEGSMLLWALILAGLGATYAKVGTGFACKVAPDIDNGATYAKVGTGFACKVAPDIDNGATFAALDRSGAFHTRALAVQGALLFGFLLYLLFVGDPFARLDPAPIDGDGLNPLLQDIGLVFHPPLLYLGYVGASLPFSLAVAALIDGRLDSGRARLIRRWTLFAWSFLTLGIAIGAWWSYYTLGWGGFWAWDPVENASLMPWLLATALTHTARASEARGVLKRWTVLLAILIFALSLVGTFLVRSGTVASVHAFALDPARGLFILVLTCVIVGGALALFAIRAGRLARDPPFAMLSRDGAILAGSVVLALACAVVMAGTLAPMAMAALGLGAVAIGPDYFTCAFAILLLPLLPLMAAGPLLAWRRGKPSLAALRRLPWSLRLAHLGLIAMVIGIVLAGALQSDATAAMRPGDSLGVGGYTVRFDALREVRGENFDALVGDFTVARDGVTIATMRPALHAFENPPATKAEIAIRTDLVRDLHLVLGAPGEDGRVAVRAMLKPAMPLVFFGMGLVFLGGLLALKRTAPAAAAPPPSPPRKRKRFAAGHAALAGFAVIAVVLAAALWRGEGPVSGAPAPKLTLPSLSGPPLRLADYEGPVVVNVFASWCAPCRAESPALLRLSQSATVIGIASRDRSEAVRAMLRDLGNPFVAVGLDDGGAAAALGVTGVPETLLIENGAIVWRHAGPLDEDTVANELIPRLGRAR